MMDESNVTSPSKEHFTSTALGTGGIKRAICDLSGSFTLEGPEGKKSKILSTDLKVIIEKAVFVAVETAIDGIKTALLESFHSKFDNLEARMVILENENGDKTKRLSSLELENKEKETLIAELQNHIHSSSNVNSNFIHEEFENIYHYAHLLESEINDVAQYTRKNNVKIFGIPEKEGENCVSEVSKILETSLDLRGIDIEVAHRLGKKRTMAQAVKSPNPRSMIVRLLKRNDKMATRISIHKDLTIRNQDLLREAQSHEDLSDA